MDRDARDDRSWVRVQSGALDVSAAVSFLSSGDHAGAVNIFVGKTRRFTDGRETIRLEYDVYPEMVVAEMGRIGAEALSRWALERVTLIHRVGSVPNGEASIVVGASSPHRAEAFEACRFLIDTVKANAPIWKRENYADGSAEWVGAAREERI